MPYDLKPDFVAAMGIAFAYGKKARWLEVNDFMSGKQLGHCSTSLDEVDIK
jgi:hypothetical protein